MKNNPLKKTEKKNPSDLLNRTEELSKIHSKLSDKKSFNIISPSGSGKKSLLEFSLKKFNKNHKINYIFFDVSKNLSYRRFLVNLCSSIFFHFNSKSEKKSNRIKKIINNSEGELSILDENKLYTKLIELVDYLNSLKSTTYIVFSNSDWLSKYFNQEAQKFFASKFLYEKNIRIILLSTEELFENSKIDKIYLKTLTRDDYVKYIMSLFNSDKKRIGKKSASYIFNFAANDMKLINIIYKHLFKLNVKKISTDEVDHIIGELISEQESAFCLLRNVLSTYQWKLLDAIGSEELAEQVTSARFMKKYELNAPSSVKTALNSLLEKELISREGNSYKINNPLFRRWVSNKQII